MKIFIPSRGRPDRQPIAEALSAANIPFTLVLTKGDPCIPEYAGLGYPYRIVKARNMFEKRNAALKGVTGKVLMFDDDVRIYARTNCGLFYKATSKDLRRMVKRIDKALNKHAHAGLCDKFMSQTRPRGHGTFGRYNQVLAYNLDLWPKGRKRPKFRLWVNSEHDVHLQLAQQGFAPWIDYEFTKDAPYYAKGGCSTYRTPEVERDAMHKFASLWPDLVTVVDHKTNISGKAIRVKWKQAVVREK